MDKSLLSTSESAKGLASDILGLGIWDRLNQALKGLLLPIFENMFSEAMIDALAELPDTGIDRDALEISAADWAREYVGDLITGIDDTTKERVRSTVANWIEAGEAFPELEKRMMDVFDSEWRARTVAVTETTRAFAYAREQTWSASRVIKKKQWQTANDELVCPICGPLQGEIRRIGSSFSGGIDNPPAHPNCRCWIVPVVD